MTHPRALETFETDDGDTSAKRQRLSSNILNSTFSEVFSIAKEIIFKQSFELGRLRLKCVGGAQQYVIQQVFEVSKFKKRNKLMEILNTDNPRATMVFVEENRTADFLASFLSESGRMTTSIHDDRTQLQRLKALCDFKKGRMTVLVATSVTARDLGKFVAVFFSDYLFDNGFVLFFFCFDVNLKTLL